MRIYVPQHLRNLEVINNLCLMVQEYQKNYKDPINSFDDYRTYMKIDPVLRFIGYCIEKTEDMDEDYYSNILNYVTRLFYSVRGTGKVFEYMSRYLGLSFEGEPVYTAKVVNFSLLEPIGEDIALFNRYLVEFLNYLLYYESLNYSIKGLQIMVSEDQKCYGGIGIITFGKFTDIEVV